MLLLGARALPGRRCLLRARLPARALPPAAQSRSGDRAGEVPARGGGEGAHARVAVGVGEPGREGACALEKKEDAGEEARAARVGEAGPAQVAVRLGGRADSERGSGSTGVPEQGSPARSVPPLGRARALCGRPRPRAARWARPGGSLSSAWRAPVAHCPLPSFPCSVRLSAPLRSPPCPARKTPPPAPSASGLGPRTALVCASCGSRSTPRLPPAGRRAPRATTCTGESHGRAAWMQTPEPCCSRGSAAFSQKQTFNSTS